MPFPLLTPDFPESCVESGCNFPFAFPGIAPGSITSNDTAVDNNVFPYVRGHSNELLLREMAKSLGVELLGKLRPCMILAVLMAKCYRKPIPESTMSRALERLGSVLLT